jgi:hypothetical protein
MSQEKLFHLMESKLLFCVVAILFLAATVLNLTLKK